MEILGKARSSIFGNPDVLRKQDNIGTAMLSEEHLLEQMRRVQQPPKMRETFAVPLNFYRWGKIDLSEKA